MSKFEDLFESEMERFQQGGFMIGDRVRFRKGALEHKYIVSKAQSYIDIVKACMEPSFDLNLRIGAIKSIFPATTQNYGAGISTPPDMVFFDIYIEYAPGLYRNPMTVPSDIIEVMDDGNNRGPVPDSLRRKNKIHAPEKVEAETDAKSDVNLTNKNVKLPGSNKWDDTQPGGGNFKIKQ
jgi:hypothetical protein